ncbi:Phosphotransferase KptA/Tpt1 [Arabidopsis suecica]|uniref:Phosphotransferase KptA/Tpt1 n=1 Tax=Arabidopsis suecica TaxID=45249 RepID=A0A8T2CCC6_ARASU|nr:Phosphotransferase KptA/Tpt1 [Arabidopsis suecica]KAG7595926.1 Phosphotransferase KptA/Tpt1 [Arabidopsis suecica]
MMQSPPIQFDKSRGGGYERERTIEWRPQGRGGNDKIDALGRLLTRILRHMATELSLTMSGDGFINVEDLLKLHLKTSAKIQLKSHTVDEMERL